MFSEERLKRTILLFNFSYCYINDGFVSLKGGLVFNPEENKLVKLCIYFEVLLKY